MKRLLLAPTPVVHSAAIQQLHAPERAVLCFHERQILCDQAKIRQCDVPDTAQEVYIVVLTNQCRVATALEQDIVKTRRMSRVEWLALRTVERHYRICTLEKNTLRVSGPADSHTLLLGSSTCLARSTELANSGPVKSSPSVLDTLSELWPHQIHTTLCTQPRQDLTLMLNLICDHALMHRELRVQPPRLYEKWHKWLKRYLTSETPYHTALYRSLVSLCQHTSSKLRGDRLDVPLLKEWLDFACYVLTQRRALLDVDLFSAQLQQHIDWIETRQHCGLYHNWAHYRVADCIEGLWIHSDARYVVSSLWLLQCDIARTEYTVQGRGRVSLTKTAFDALLVQMHRLVLCDLIQLMRSVAMTGHYEDGDFDVDYRELYHINHRDCVEAKTVALLQRSLHTQSCHELYAFQLETQYYTSPVMRALIAQQQQQDAIDEKRGDSDPRTIARRVPDIEDLATKTPPCMQALLTRTDRNKNWDRLNLVAWLYDAGYEREAVIRHMCRNAQANGSEEERQIIGELYDDCVSPPESRWRSRDGGLSVPCGTVINSLYEAGNILRCPYEKAKNKDVRRKKHTDAEKQLFQAQCASCGGLKRNTISHPLDFVLDKIANPVQ